MTRAARGQLLLQSLNEAKASKGKRGMARRRPRSGESAEKALPRAAHLPAGRARPCTSALGVSVGVPRRRPSIAELPAPMAEPWALETRSSGQMGRLRRAGRTEHTCALHHRAITASSRQGRNNHAIAFCNPETRDHFETQRERSAISIRVINSRAAPRRCRSWCS